MIVYHGGPLLQPWRLTSLEINVLLCVWVRCLKIYVLLEISEVGLKLLDLLPVLLPSRFEGIFHVSALLDKRTN